MHVRINSHELMIKYTKILIVYNIVSRIIEKKN
jgi:hypothetical protein